MNPLPLGFRIPGPKTLKTEVDTSVISLSQAIENARQYLNNQTQYTRIEFKYERNYIVIAKLKEN